MSYADSRPWIIYISVFHIFHFLFSSNTKINVFFFLFFFLEGTARNYQSRLCEFNQVVNLKNMDHIYIYI